MLNDTGQFLYSKNSEEVYRESTYFVAQGL
jgi:hypothetical protein